MSLTDASVSTEKLVSQLPRRDEAPPSEASVAADSMEAVLDAWWENAVPFKVIPQTSFFLSMCC